jgi:hypothetical protein
MSAGVMSRDGGDDERARVKRSALVLALVAAAVYVGFILWGLLHGIG